MIVFQRLQILFLLTILLLLGANSVFATEFAVGTCKPSLHSFSTISAAVSSVPSGSTVLVCPGTYAEQVTISQPLTLEGITIGNSNQAIITVPAAGLVLDESGFAAQVEVTADPVNITNITVDGTGNNLGGSAPLIGIRYLEGSGVMKGVTIRNQLDSGQGTGIVAESGNSEPLTIEDCSVHDFDEDGIDVVGNFTATVKANHINGSGSVNGTGVFIKSAGSVTDNNVSGRGISFGTGILGDFPGVIISDNTVSNWAFGLLDSDAAKYTSNTVGNTGTGVLLEVAGATVESNTITQASVGIDFECETSTVKSNMINDAATGINNVPSGLTSTNTYYSVSEIRSACSSADSRKRMEMPRIPHTPDGP